MRLSFYGACREVTGSNILLEAAGKKILLDCGFFQGFRLAEERNYAPFSYDPKSISNVVIGHAHLDHIGRLPKLVKEGFCGQIYCTAPTKDLTQLVLEDSQKLMREEAQRNHHSPLYEEIDISKVMKLFKTIEYTKRVEISPGINLTLKNAGHILGSSLTILEADNTKLVYTSDIGNSPSQLLNPPSEIQEADYLICESTYGGRVHEDINKRMEKLSNILSSTIATSGVLMIPTFAIERAQELLHDIEHFCNIEGCEKPTFYLDSPLASKVTSVFKRYPEFMNNKLKVIHKNDDFFGLYRVNITESVEDSKAINSSPNPKVIIAGSGMINGGRIIHHLKQYIENRNNTLLIIGYQANGTLGREILDGEKEIKLFGKKYSVNSQVKAIGSYSAHADMPQLVNWISKIQNLKKLFLVHGESDQMVIFSKELKTKLNLDSVIVQQNEKYELS